MKHVGKTMVHYVTISEACKHASFLTLLECAPLHEIEKHISIYNLIKPN